MSHLEPRTHRGKMFMKDCGQAERNSQIYMYIFVYLMIVSIELSYIDFTILYDLQWYCIIYICVLVLYIYNVYIIVAYIYYAVYICVCVLIIVIHIRMFL